MNKYHKNLSPTPAQQQTIRDLSPSRQELRANLFSSYFESVSAKYVEPRKARRKIARNLAKNYWKSSNKRGAV